MKRVKRWIFRFITLRRAVQLSFFFLFLWLVVRTVYIFEGEEPVIPRELFLRFDPLAGLLTALSSRSGGILVAKFIPALIILALTFLLGRFFCNWICPLGTTLDAADKVVRPKTRRVKGKPKLRYSSRLRNLKYYLLIFFIVAALFSTQLSWLMDPISIVARSYQIVLYPYFVKFIESISDTLYKIPILNGLFDPIYGFLRMRIYPFPEELPPVFQLQFAAFLFFAVILFLVRYYPRFWCRALCPLGAMLGACSKTTLLRRVVDGEKCIDCQRCKQECKMDAITENPRGYRPQECVECLTCRDVCPADAIAFKLANPFGKEEFGSEGPGASRRNFIKAAALGALAFPVMKLKPQEKDYNPFLIRPPGSLPEEGFLDKCIRCGVCMKACPTNALQPALFQGGLEGMGTPILVPKIGYCEYECNTCTLLCPTGAIRKLEIEEKKRFKIGTAYINKNKCYPWNENINCLVCEEHCPVPEKAIKFWEVEVLEQRTNKPKTVLRPYVVTELCIGCGICENKCPIPEEPGIRVTTRFEVRHRERYTGSRGGGG